MLKNKKKFQYFPVLLNESFRKFAGKWEKEPAFIHLFVSCSEIVWLDGDDFGKEDLGLDSWVSSGQPQGSAHDHHSGISALANE